MPGGHGLPYPHLPPKHIFFFFFLLDFAWYQSYYPHTLREISGLPYAGFKKKIFVTIQINYYLNILYCYTFFIWLQQLNLLHTFFKTNFKTIFFFFFTKKKNLLFSKKLYISVKFKH